MAEEADRLKQEANKLFKGLLILLVQQTCKPRVELGVHEQKGLCSIDLPGQTWLMKLLLLPFAEKHYSGAIQLYSQAIDLQPSNAVLYANRAFAHIKIEEYGSAVTDASKAIDADPSYAKVGSVLAGNQQPHILHYISSRAAGAATHS
jgi:tetratricopeptide (TPR) repeat protein